MVNLKAIWRICKWLFTVAGHALQAPAAAANLSGTSEERKARRGAARKRVDDSSANLARSVAEAPRVVKSAGATLGVGSAVSFCALYLLHDLVGWEPDPEAAGQFGVVIAFAANRLLAKL